MSKSLSLVMTLLVLCGSAAAHHGNSAYDETARVPIKGTVTEFVWTNPHSQIYLDVKDKNGSIVHWGIETNSPGILTRAGWTRRSLKPGDEVTVILCPAKNGEPVAYIGFTGATNVVAPIEDHDRAVSLGIEQARALVGL